MIGITCLFGMTAIMSWCVWVSFCRRAQKETDDATNLVNMAQNTRRKRTEEIELDLYKFPWLKHTSPVNKDKLHLKTKSQGIKNKY